jgi:TolB-like protein
MSKPGKAVFLSYASQDAEAARRIAEALRTAGVEVWFDQSELVGGEAWDRKIRRQIGSCALFVPVISASTQARLEGYFRLEWKIAAQRTHTMADERVFLLPVVIDSTRDAEASVPAEFKNVQWTRLPSGETPPVFVARVKSLLEGGSGPPDPSDEDRRVIEPPPTHGTEGWWDALRRRKVAQWGMLYVAGAWGFLQGFEFLSDTYGWPLQLQQLATLALLIGLPIVLVVAWYHGDRGHQRVTTAEFAIITLLLLLGGGALAFYQRNNEGGAEAALAAPGTSAPPASPGAPDARPSLAVLPFVDLSQLKDQEYLGDGLAEEIINQLTQVPGLRLVGRTSSFSFKGKDDDLRTIGDKLGVAHLLEGSVRKSGERIRITAQLVAASDSSQLWSKTYDRNLTDVFAVQDEIARDVAQALSVKLDAVMLNTAQGGTTNVDAYDRYLRWRQLFLSEYFDEEHDRQRVRLAREAVAFDPAFVLGWDALAKSLDALAREVGGEQAERLREEAVQVRARIAELAPDHWIVKRNRAYALWREGKWTEAIALTKEIMEGGPMSYERAFPYTELIFSVGYLDETVAVVEQLKTIEPLAMFISRDLQYDYTAARRFDDAEAEYQRSLSLEGNDAGPTNLAFHRMLARPDAAPTALRELHGRLVKMDDWPFLLDLGGALNDRDAMLAILREAAQDPVYGGGRDAIVFQMETADALGDADLAVNALRRYLESVEGFADRSMRHGVYWQFWTMPHSGVRSHPEFKRLLIQTGVADYWRQTGKWGDGCKPIGEDDFQCE